MLSKGGALIAPISAASPPVVLPVLIQQAVASDSSGGGDAVGSFASNTTAGNSIIYLVSYAGEPASFFGAFFAGVQMTASKSSGTAGGVIGVEIGYVHNITGGGGANNSFEAATGGSTVSILCQEWSGLSNAGAEDVNGAVANGATVASGSVTASSAHNLVVAVGGWTANDYLSGPTNSFTRSTQTGGAGAFQEGAYLIQSAATAKSTGWGLTAGINWAAAIAVFGAP